MRSMFFWNKCYIPSIFEDKIMISMLLVSISISGRWEEVFSKGSHSWHFWRPNQADPTGTNNWVKGVDRCRHQARQNFLRHTWLYNLEPLQEKRPKVRRSRCFHSDIQMMSLMSIVLVGMEGLPKIFGGEVCLLFCCLGNRIWLDHRFYCEQMMGRCGRFEVFCKSAVNLTPDPLAGVWPAEDCAPAQMDLQCGCAKSFDVVTDELRQLDL